MNLEFAGKRALVLGAETDTGVALVQALAEASADVAAVASKHGAEASFAAKRAARKATLTGRRAVALAIDAGNEMAMRVMARQSGKELGGLDSAFIVVDDPLAFSLACRFLGKEMARTGGGIIIGVGARLRAEPTAGGSPVTVRTMPPRETVDATVQAALNLIADETTG